MNHTQNLMAGALAAALAGTLLVPAAQAQETATSASSAQSQSQAQTQSQTAAPAPATTSPRNPSVMARPAVATQNTSAAPQGIQSSTTGPVQEFTANSSESVQPIQPSSAPVLPWAGTAVAPEPSLTIAADAAQLREDAVRQGFPFIYQGQGQPEQWHDCGPSVTLMALAQRHRAPASFSAEHLAASLIRFRAENVRHDPHGGMTVEEIQQSLARHHVDSQAVSGAPAADQLQQVKEGKQAITMGQTGIISEENARSGYAHYIYIRGYDQRTGEFTVADPLNRRHRTQKVSESTLRTFIDSNAKVNPAQLVMTF